MRFLLGKSRGRTRLLRVICLKNKIDTFLSNKLKKSRLSLGISDLISIVFTDVNLMHCYKNRNKKRKSFCSGHPKVPFFPYSLPTVLDKESEVMSLHTNASSNMQIRVLSLILLGQQNECFVPEIRSQVTKMKGPS
ncbi:hypothetical protein CEXT_709011 [Caerostris extrusa]|uniref:Uncharacterized protein n=1 Tax=Caerostris extrusa TaxID=172846 RepID=A0AAV4NHI8_CAEEX|nr:hypothetical protein CEXT_709011 [Caerostris extrusa]